MFDAILLSLAFDQFFPLGESEVNVGGENTSVTLYNRSKKFLSLSSLITVINIIFLPSFHHMLNYCYSMLSYSNSRIIYII